SKVKAIHFAVTDIKGNLIGIINVNSLRKIIFRSELYRMYKAEQLMQKPTLLLRTDDSMQSVMDKFQSVDAATLPVVNPEGHFEGFVSKTRLYSLYRQIIKDFSEE
ncbi:MAG: CBS domain-containing protein, partial [Candidatus Limisoma sp.]